LSEDERQRERAPCRRDEVCDLSDAR
jgi:hypothetical protein